MKKLIFLIVSLLSLSTYAAPDQNLESFSCTSEEGISVIGEKMQCRDPRYIEWQQNGCYHVVVSRGEEILFEEEMVRSVPFYLELRQKFYSMYVWGKDEWAMRSFIVQFEADRGEQFPYFQFDHHESSRAPFEKIKGSCSVVNN